MYDIKYGESLNRAQWWNLINQEMCSKSFWIYNKNKLGSFETKIKYFIIWLFIICILVSIIFFQSGPNQAVVINASHAVLVTIFICILWRHLPNGIYDVFHIRTEIKLFVFLFGCLALLQVVMSASGMRDTTIGWEITAITTWYVCRVDTIKV